MGRFTNPVLIAAGATLIVVGVAAQTGTVNLSRQAGVRQGANAIAPPEASSSPLLLSPTPAPSPPSATPVATQGGGGQGDGGDGGGDGGD